MELILLGTGCPAPHPERYGPAQVVRLAGTALLIDVGSGVTQRMAQAGLTGRDLDALLLTHLHSDHIVDLFQLIVSSWHQGRDRPQRVYGPRGTRRFVEGLLALWRPELELRIAHERRPSTVALEVEVTEIEGGARLSFGALDVAVVEVDHKPVRQAFGYVVTGGGMKLAISGDTRRCAALIEAARGADLLLHEVFVHREMIATPGVRSAETIERVASYHTLSSEVGRIAEEAQAKALALTHFVPPGCDRAALYAEVAKDFARPLLLGEDLMVFDLAARRASYRGQVTGLAASSR